MSRCPRPSGGTTNRDGDDPALNVRCAATFLPWVTTVTRLHPRVRRPPTTAPVSTIPGPRRERPHRRRSADRPERRVSPGVACDVTRRAAGMLDDQHLLREILQDAPAKSTSHPVRTAHVRKWGSASKQVIS